MTIDSIALNNAQILIPVKDLTDTIRNIFEEVFKSQNFQSETPSSTDLQDNDLLTRKEACSLLGISLPTLSKYVASGKLPYLKIGKKLLFDKKLMLIALQNKGGKNVR